MKEGERNERRDRRLDTLLDLGGQVFVIDERGDYWVKFDVKRVPATKERPHGLDYSFTMHGPGNERLVGFDNAHAVRRSGGPVGATPTYDHRHRMGTIRPYAYRDPATLVADFWAEVDSVLKEKGIEL
jgi:hypothetical protein